MALDAPNPPQSQPARRLPGWLTLGLRLAATVALMATLVGARKPWLGLSIGVIVTLLLLPLADPSDQQQRALLWTGGLAVHWPAGEGGWLNQAILQWDRLQPGFWFPYHAHDGMIQVWGVLGPSGLGALIWLLASLFRGPAAAAMVGVLVGCLTQNVFGDLEVARSLWFWCMVLTLRSSAELPGVPPAVS